MMSRVLGCHDRRALAHAIDLGIAMQLTNIARDVLEDAEMGRRYLPETWVGRLTPRRIVALSADPTNDETIKVTAAVERLIRLAEKYYMMALLALLSAVSGASVDCHCCHSLPSDCVQISLAGLCVVFWPAGYKYTGENHLQCPCIFNSCLSH